MKKPFIIALLAVTFSMSASATDWSELIGKELVLYQWGKTQDRWFSEIHPTNSVGKEPVERIILSDSTHVKWKYTQQGTFARECSIEDSVLTFKEPIFGNEHLRILECDGEVMVTLGEDNLSRAFSIIPPKPEPSQLPTSAVNKKKFCNGKLDDLLPYITDITYSSRTTLGRNFLYYRQASEEDKAWLESTQEVFDDSKEQLKAYDINLFPHDKPVLADVYHKGMISVNAISVLTDMAILYPEFIKSIIHQESPDSFVVDMFDPEGKPIVVCISNRFPVVEDDNGIFCIGEGGEYNWISILEKAILKWIQAYSRQFGVIGSYNAEMITPMLTGDGRSFCIQSGRLGGKDLNRVINTCLENGMMVNGVADNHIMSFMDNNTNVPSSIGLRVISPGAAAKYFDKNAVKPNKERIKEEKEVKIKLKKGEVPLLANYPSADMNSLPLHGGDVLIRGRIVAGDPQVYKQFEGRISSIMRNYIVRKERTTLFEIKEDGTFSLNLHVPYPMYLLVYPMADVYACPGDTVDVIIDTTKPSREEGVILDGTGLSGEVSRLTRKIRDVYCDFSADYEEMSGSREASPDTLLKWKDKLVERLDYMVCKMNAGLPELEGCSPMASDIIRTYIVAAYMDHISDYYNTPDVEGFDRDAFWRQYFSFAAPRERYLLDNPLLMISADEFFFNRVEYSLMRPLHIYYSNPIFGADEKRAMNEIHEKLNLSPTDFTAQVCVLRNLVSYELKNAADRPEYATDVVAKKFSVINHPELMRQGVLAYREHIKDNEVKVIEEKPMTKADTIFQRIIEPYKGNVLFVDFWNMACGPCRQSMLSMRDEVEANKDKPVKYLYITDDSEEKCRSFLEPNNIKGEHIHITRAEWGYMKEKFQFSGIPFAVLFDKNGKQRKNTTIEELLKE